MKILVDFLIHIHISVMTKMEQMGNQLNIVLLLLVKMMIKQLQVHNH